jgi:hypothetical protein
MLVVVVIIGILATLITVAAQQATVAVKRAKISTEIHDLELALGAYKEKLGDYPPDFTDVDAFIRHLAKAFPRYPAGIKDNNGRYRWQNDLATVGIDFTKLNPATALAFWLGGMRDAGGIPSGFSANPSNPFDNSPSRIGPFFEFDRKRLDKPEADNSGNAIPWADRLNRYVPGNGVADSEPYVYFRPRYYRVNNQGQPLPENNQPSQPAAKYWQQTDPNGNALQGAAMVRPYCDAQLAGGANWVTRPDAFWVNRTTFQILSPGLDGRYRNADDVSKNLQPGNAFPFGTDYISAQFDDITNFSGGTLQSKMP